MDKLIEMLGMYIKTIGIGICGCIYLRITIDETGIVTADDDSGFWSSELKFATIADLKIWIHKLEQSKREYLGTEDEKKDYITAEVRNSLGIGKKMINYSECEQRCGNNCEYGSLIVKEDINARTYEENVIDNEDQFEAARADAQEKWVRDREQATALGLDTDQDTPCGMAWCGNNCGTCER